MKASDDGIPAVGKSLFDQPDKKGGEPPYEEPILDPTRAFRFDEPCDSGGSDLVKVIDPLNQNDIPEEQGDASANLDERPPLLGDGGHVALDEWAKGSCGPEDQISSSEGGLPRVFLGLEELIEGHG